MLICAIWWACGVHYQNKIAQDMGMRACNPGRQNSLLIVCYNIIKGNIITYIFICVY